MGDGVRRSPRSPRLQEAQEALGRGAWREAQTAFLAAVADQESAEAWDGLGQACWWLGEVRLGVGYREQAFTAYLAAGRHVEAALVAVDLSVWQLTSLDNEAAARGWLARAVRAAETGTGQADPAVRGWITLTEAYLRGDDAGARDRIEEARRLARETGDADLDALALADLGLWSVRTGAVADGLALLDEAMAAALGTGPQRLETVVWSSCNMLAACSVADDLARAAQWCRAADAFMETYGCPFLDARCRAHYGRVLVSTGRWQLAETELQRALTMAQDTGLGPRAEAVAALAELRLRQGRAEDAAQLLEDLPDSPSVTLTRAGVHLQRGAPARAVSELRAAVALLPAAHAESAALVAMLSEALLAAGDVAAAAELVGAEASVWEGASLPRSQALLVRAQGRVAAARGDAGTGLVRLAAALDAFTRLDLPFETAHTQLDVARVLRQSEPDAAVTRARSALRRFQRLGAAAGADEAAVLLRSWGVATGPGPRRHDVLTQREAEVLALLAAGLSNPEIGGRLFLSPRTVGHHVSSILRKLDLHSRGEAAAYAARRFP